VQFFSVRSDAEAGNCTLTPVSPHNLPMNGFQFWFFISIAAVLSNMPVSPGVPNRLMTVSGRLIPDGSDCAKVRYAPTMQLHGHARCVYVRKSRADTSIHKFPMEPDSLDGKRVLLIVIPSNASHTAYFVTGVASWTDEELKIRSSPEAAPIVAKGTRVALQGFDPALLPRLIIPSYYHQVADVANGAVACVVIFAPSAPVGALALRDPFFGLASGKDRQVLLMQGNPGSP
jgi:hypothetical protein